VPIPAYFKGHGAEVLENMRSEYGDKKGKSVFFATAQKRGLKPAQDGVVASYDPMPAPPQNPTPLSPYDQSPVSSQGAVPPMGTSPSMPPMPQSQGMPPAPMPNNPMPGMRKKKKTPEEEALLAQNGPIPPDSTAPPPPQTGRVLNTSTPPPSDINKLEAGETTPGGAIPGEMSQSVAGQPSTPPFQSRIGNLPLDKPAAEANQAYVDAVHKKVPGWKEALGITLSSIGLPQIGNRLSREGQAAGAFSVAQHVGALANQETQQEAEREAAMLRSDQIATTRAWREEANANRLAAIKPQLTVRERYLQAMEIPGMDDSTAQQFALNPTGVKQREFASSPQGIFSTTTGDVKSPATPKPLVTPPGSVIRDASNPANIIATNDPKETNQSKEYTGELRAAIRSLGGNPDDPKLSPDILRKAITLSKTNPNINIVGIPGLGGGSGANSAPVGGSLTGQEYLDALQQSAPGTAAQVKAISEGRATIPPLGTRGSGALIRDAVFKYDPQFNEQRAQIRKAFTTGPDGRNIGALNTASIHLGQLHDAVVAMNNGSFQPGNAVYNYIAQKFGSDKPTNQQFVLNALAGEAATALKGNATDPEIAHVLASLQGGFSSPQQALGITQEGLKVFGAKLRTYEDRYKQTNPDDNVWSPIMPSAKAVFDKYGINPLSTNVAPPGAQHRKPLSEHLQ
jgi:hypothetical protein